MSSGIKVISPASVSNLACGFDILGMALDIPCDEIIGRWTDTPGITIAEIRGAKDGIPKDPASNIAGVAAQALLTHLGEDHRGIELRMTKHIRAGSGLGSSAASATAAVVLVNAMLGNPLEKRDLLSFALRGEMMASGTPVGDNLVSSLLGGLHLVRDITTFDYHRIYTPRGLHMAILLPHIRITTLEARQILSPTVPLTDTIRQSANLGAFVIGMHNGDFELISRSMQDVIIEPQRIHLIPHYEAIKEKALSLGAIACNISGAGPALFALCLEKTLATEVATGMKQVLTQHKLDSTAWAAGIHTEGAMLM